MHAAIPRTCRQINAEAVDVPFRTNAFHYQFGSLTPTWIAPRSTDDYLPESLMPLGRVARIRNLYILVCTGTISSAECKAGGFEAYGTYVHHPDEAMAMGEWPRDLYQQFGNLTLQVTVCSVECLELDHEL